MSALAVRLAWEELRTLASGSISGTYAGIGAAFANPARIIHLFNGTDVVITFSFNGTTDHLVLPTNGFLLLDVTSNKTTQVSGFYIAEGTRVYAKGSPTTGAVYLSVIYGTEGY